MRRGWLVGGVALFALVGGCQLDASSTPGTHLVFATGPDRGDAIHHRTAEFEKLHPDIHVDLLEMPSDADTEHNQYATYLIAEDSTVDVYAVDVVWPAEFGSAGWAEPLESRYPPDEWAKFLKGPLQSCQSAGHTWAVPWYADAGMLYYRKDLLAQAGLKPPTTWAELLADCKKCQDPPDLYGYLGQWDQYEGLVCNFCEFAWGNGGDILSPTGQVVVDSPNNVEALQFMTDLFTKDKVTAPGVNTYMEDQSLNLFMTGRALFCRQWPYAWAQCQTGPSSKVKGLVGVCPLPHGPHGESAAALGGWNLMLSKYSRHKDEAWAYIQYMTSERAEKAMVFDASYLSTREAVYRDPEVLEKMPVMGDFYEVFKQGHPRPVTPYYSQVSDILQSTVHRAIDGTVTPQAALQQAQRDIDGLPGLAGRR